MVEATFADHLLRVAVLVEEQAILSMPEKKAVLTKGSVITSVVENLT